MSEKTDTVKMVQDANPTLGLLSRREIGEFLDMQDGLAKAIAHSRKIGSTEKQFLRLCKHAFRTWDLASDERRGFEE